MAKTTKFVARYNGEIIGTRKSHRVYTHAVIAQYNEAAANAAAYGYVGTAFDRHQFDWSARVAAAKIGDVLSYTAFGDRRPFPVTVDAEDFSRAHANTEGGWEGYVQRLRDRAIVQFHDAVDAGGFRPFVYRWSMSLRAVNSGAAEFSRGGGIVLAIVPAEIA